MHVHTDDPGAALSLGVAMGTIDGIEIANMHEQTHQREERLLAVVPDPPAARATTGVVAVVAGSGNRRLFESLANGMGPIAIVEGGQTMNPSTADLLAAIESLPSEEAIVLPNNSNIVLAAEHAAAHASKPAVVVAADSIPAGLAAMIAFDGSRTAAENAAEMREAVDAVATGEVTIASRDVADERDRHSQGRVARARRRRAGRRRRRRSRTSPSRSRSGCSRSRATS